MLPAAEQIHPLPHPFTINGRYAVAVIGMGAQRQMNRINVLGNLLLDSVGQRLIDKSALLRWNISQTINRFFAGDKADQQNIIQCILAEGMFDGFPTVACAASLFVAGSEWRGRIGAAFDWRDIAKAVKLDACEVR